MKTFSNLPGDGEIKIPVRCPVCDETRVAPRWDFGAYGFQRCLGCGHLYQNPMPRPEDLERRYAGTYRDYEVENAANFLNLMLLGLEDLGFYDWERAFPKVRRFLDVGCATGALVEYLVKRGWDAYGLEICEEAAEYGRSRRGVKIFSSTLDAVPLAQASLDLIHSSHVIEHVPDPRAYLALIRGLLRPGGLSVTVTPNAASLQALLFGREWRSAIADHVNLFSVKGLMTLHRKAGLEPLGWVTWGGLAAGTAPAWLKGLADRAIKKTPWGDVAALLSRRPGPGEPLGAPGDF